jgi:hypothetical protein
MCDAKGAEVEDVDDPELVGAQRQFAINRKYARALACSAGATETCGSMSGDQTSALSRAVASLVSNGGFNFDQTRPKEPDAFWLRRRRTQAGAAGTLDEARWEKAIKNALFCAWTAEHMIAVQQHYLVGDQLTKLSNNWAVVQAYYVLHHLVQALRIAVGQSVLENHKDIHKAFRLQWQLPTDAQAPRQDLQLLEPWLASYRRPQPTAYYQYHVGLAPVEFEPYAVSHLAPFDPLDSSYILSECLRTTHRQAIEDRPKAVRDAHKEPYTLADYLYRFRCKRNYGDNISFIRGPLTEDESRGLQDDLLYLSAATAVVYEHRLMAIPHPASRVPLEEQVLGWMHEWLAMSVADPDAVLVALRVRLALDATKV